MATAKEAPTRTKDDPTIAEANAANSGAYAGDTRTVERFGRNRWLKIAFGGGVITAGGWTLYETVPAVHRAVDSAFLDHLRGKSITEASTIKPEEVFDNTATKGVVGPNTILYIPKEEFDKLPSADGKGNPIFDFPWDPNHPMEIKYTQPVNDEASIAWLKSNGVTNAEDYRGYKGGQYSENKLPVGYEVPTICAGRLYFMGSVWNKEASQKSPSNPYGLAVYDPPFTSAHVWFHAPNGVLYHVLFEVIDDSGGVEKPLPLQPLVDAPVKPGFYGDQGVLIERSQKIFRTTKEGKLKFGIITAYKDGNDRSPIRGNLIAGNLNYNTVRDNTGLDKIPVTESK